MAALSKSQVDFSQFVSSLSCLFTLLVMLPYADLVLLTGATSMSVVYGVFLAMVMLGEKPNPLYDSATVILVLTGCLLTVSFANNES